jgi:hypothetical protein
MRALERSLEAATKKPKEVPVEPELDNRAKERVQRLRRIDVNDAAKYQQLLKQDGTGIFKIFPDLHCVSKNVIRVAGECERYVPLSSSFTFREGQYINPSYHDIYFENGKIFSKSFFLQGIFGAIGDEPVEGLSLSHPAINFLAVFEPAANPKDAASHAKQFRSGLDDGGYLYADNITPQVNVTYAMRTIAYRLENSLRPMSNETTTDEMMFLSLAFDKRLDMIVVFRILGRDEFDGLTIVWKELKRKDAAKIKFGKREVLKDFRSDLK